LIKVLVIDDNKEITDMLSFYLESLGGYGCKVLNDGKEGLEAMPEFNGIDIINSLKKDKLLEKKNVILSTASSLDGQDAENLVRDGIKAILKKPISVDELTTVIQ